MIKLMEFPEFVKKKFGLNRDMAYNGVWYESIFSSFIYCTGIQGEYLKEYTEFKGGSENRIEVNIGDDPYRVHDFAVLEESDEFLPKVKDKLIEDDDYSKRLLDKIITALKNIEKFIDEINNKDISENEIAEILRKYVELYIKTTPFSYLWYSDFKLVHDISEWISNNHKLQKEFIEEIILSDPEGINLDEELDDKTKAKIEKIDFTQKEKSLIVFLRKNFAIKTLRKKVLYKCDECIMPFLKIIAEKIGVDGEDILMLGPYEILDLLEGKKDIDVKELILQRKKRWAVITIDMKNMILSSVDFPEIILEKNKDNQIFKGNVVYKGKVSGKVRIIKTKEDVKEFKEGEIFVADMVNQEHNIVVKKAKAILTQRGGILSHTAIIGRELKIPTIMDVKNITNSLENGDLVEVDADNGVVRKIK